MNIKDLVVEEYRKITGQHDRDLSKAVAWSLSIVGQERRLRELAERELTEDEEPYYRAFIHEALVTRLKNPKIASDAVKEIFSRN